MGNDAFLNVSDAQAVTVTAVSTSSINMLARKDIAPGTPIHANITVGANVTAAGAATVTFEIITASDAALTADIEVLASTGAIGKAALTAGRIPIMLTAQPATGIGQTYLGVRYTVATGPLTAGNFTAYITPLVETADKQYPKGWSITV